MMKNIFNKVFTILLFGLLATGFQVQNSNTQTMDSLLSFAGVEEAYAGPCANRGCLGPDGACGVCYSVIEIGNFSIRRCCQGKISKKVNYLR